MTTDTDQTPPEIREGVRSGIFSAIREDVERRGGRTARLLAVAGVAGIVGAAGVTLLISRHPFGHHPTWHVAMLSALWSGLLVVAVAFALLRLRTPTLPLDRAAAIGVLGLGIAGLCSAVCPDPHFLHWWSGTSIGAPITRVGGTALSALCFGIVTTFFFGAVSTILLLGVARQPVKAFIPATALFILLIPGVTLQSVDTSFGILLGWLMGAAAGAYLGVAVGIRARALFFRPSAG